MENAVEKREEGEDFRNSACDFLLNEASVSAIISSHSLRCFNLRSMSAASILYFILG